MNQNHLQLFDDPIRDDCFFADEEGFEKFKNNLDKIKKMSMEMLNDEYLNNPAFVDSQFCEIKSHRRAY